MEQLHGTDYIDTDNKPFPDTSLEYKGQTTLIHRAFLLAGALLRVHQRTDYTKGKTSVCWNFSQNTRKLTIKKSNRITLLWHPSQSTRYTRGKTIAATEHKGK